MRLKQVSDANGTRLHEDMTAHGNSRETHSHRSNQDAAEANGGVWAMLFLAVPVGIFAGMFSLVVGGSPLTALIWYSLIGSLCLLILLSILFIKYPTSNEDNAVARPIANVRSDTLGKVGLRESAAIWVQWSPVGLAVSDQRVFCVGSLASPSIGSQLGNLMAKRGYGVDLCNCLDTAIATIAIDSHLWSILYVDVDECERHAEIDEIVQALHDFRASDPKVIVILCSLSFARDDCNTDRLSIADASLRKPITARRVVESMEFAYTNNQQWQNRINDVAKELSYAPWFG